IAAGCGPADIEPECKTTWVLHSYPHPCAGQPDRILFHQARLFELGLANIRENRQLDQIEEGLLWVERIPDLIKEWKLYSCLNRRIVSAVAHYLERGVPAHRVRTAQRHLLGDDERVRRVLVAEAADDVDPRQKFLEPVDRDVEFREVAARAQPARVGIVRFQPARESIQAELQERR